MHFHKPLKTKINYNLYYILICLPKIFIIQVNTFLGWGGVSRDIKLKVTFKVFVSPSQSTSANAENVSPKDAIPSF